MRGLMTRVLLLWCVVVLAACDRSGNAAQTTAPPEVNVFIAASTAHVIEPLAEAFGKETGIIVHCNAASSSTLAMQIEHGAPADIYLSANQNWMDHLAELKLIQPESRIDLLGNLIVLVAHATGIPATAGDLMQTLANYTGCLAMGDPDHVPAGMYGKAALETLGLWETVAPHVAPAKDVRSALLLVERGEADFGIVYSTDAASSDAVTTVATFPESSHEPIRYPIALTINAGVEAKQFYDLLLGERGRAAFEAAGFTFIGGSADAH